MGKNNDDLRGMYSNSDEERRRAEARHRKAMIRKKKRRRKIMMMKVGVVSLLILLVLIIVFLAGAIIKHFTGTSSADLETLVQKAQFVGLDKVTDGKTAEITSYDTYGVHFNLSGKLTPGEGESVKYLELCMVDAYDNPALSEDNTKKDSTEKDSAKKDTTGTEIEANTDVLGNNEVVLQSNAEEDGSISFTTSNVINEGICLETSKEGYYCYLIKAVYNDGTSEYFTLSDASGMEAIDYYTITKDGKNNEISISFKQSEIDSRSYLAFINEDAELPADVYDVVIDAGHGGTDTGALSDSITEAELTLQYAKALQKLLEADGYKVKLTRDGTESKDLDMAYTMYDDDGRVNVACGSGAKMCFCIHFNSNSQVTAGGVEVYCTNHGNSDFASMLADSIVEGANTYYSSQNTYKVASGVYERTYTEEEITKSVSEAVEKGFEPYALTTDTDYLFMIRELGGMMTNAYIDGRNTKYGTNHYINSNTGIESYLLELGYMSVDSDLSNMVSNSDAYVKAIADAFQNYMDTM